MCQYDSQYLNFRCNNICDEFINSAFYIVKYQNNRIKVYEVNYCEIDDITYKETLIMHAGMKFFFLIRNSF